jgi:hypothetical protein
MLASLAAAAYVLWAPWRESKSIIAKEEEALGAARAVAAAQRTFRERRLKDANRDGAAEYGTLEDLAAAGLLPRAVSREPAPAHLAVGAYRVEVLLPERLETAEGRRTLGRAGRPVDPALAAETFAVVALPGPDRTTGMRGLYVDQTGRTWHADEVTDPDVGTATEPPPWTLREETEAGAGNAGPFWLLSGKDRAPK